MVWFLRSLSELDCRRSLVVLRKSTASRSFTDSSLDAAEQTFRSYTETPEHESYFLHRTIRIHL